MDAVELSAGAMEYEDTGGAIVQLVVATGSERVSRIGLVSCDVGATAPRP